MSSLEAVGDLRKQFSTIQYMCRGMGLLIYGKLALLEEAMFELELEFGTRAQSHASLNGLEQGQKRDDGECVLPVTVAHVQGLNSGKSFAQKQKTAVRKVVTKKGKC